MASILTAAIGTVLLAAGVFKLLRFADTVVLWKDHRLLPIPLVPTLAIAVISIELTLGIGVLIPRTTRFAAAGSSLLFLGFSAYLKAAMNRGAPTGCGCFGFDTMSIRPTHVMRTLILAVGAGVCAVLDPTTPTVMSIVNGIALAACFILATSLLGLLTDPSGRRAIH